MTVVTESGSIYEIDAEQQLIRRVGSKYRDDQRATEDWRPYEAIYGPMVSQNMVIVWPDTVPPIGPDKDVVKLTTTSRVSSISHGN